MRLLLLLTGMVAALLPLTAGHSCAPCTLRRFLKCLRSAPSLARCAPFGRHPTVCGCGCKVCARWPGQKCGGPWGIFGKCGYGLVCWASGNSSPFATGKCIWQHYSEPTKLTAAGKR